MSIYNELKHDVFLTGPDLREMGANVTDGDGILWTPGDQTVSKNGGGIALSPDPTNLKQVFAKRACVFTGKSETSGAKNGPAKAYDRMLARRDTRALITRLRRKGLVPTPSFYAKIRPAANRPVPKPQVTASSVIRRSIHLLRIMPGGLDAMTGPVARIAQSLGPKKRLLAHSFG